VNDPQYPKYHVKYKWTDACKCGDACTSTDGHCNGTTADRMYKTDIGEDAVRAEAVANIERWSANEPGKFPPLDQITITITRLPDAAWCLKWFSHWTFDTGADDAEVLASFTRYVMATQKYNAANMIEYTGSDGGRRYIEPMCLMGAEDRWRWKAYIEKDVQGEPPCRCEGCKKAGIISICH
jgi:hypothetical protein